MQLPGERMTHLSYDERQPWAGLVAGQPSQIQHLRLVRSAVIVGLAYYFGAKVGFALTLRPSPVSTLWPPNSILLAAFLLTPVRSWWALLGGAFVAHLTVQLQGGIPLPMVLGWFVSNASEGLIGAGIVRHYIKGPLKFETFREASVFVAGAAFIGTAISSFLDAGFVSLVGWAQSSYWDVWFSRISSNVLATLTLVPVIVTWTNEGLSAFRARSLWRYLEAVFLAAGLLGTCLTVFGGLGTAPTAPALVYAPLPFLIWAAIRFGPRGTSACLLVVAALAIWGAVSGRGPFVSRSAAENALSIQLFLTVVSIPLLTLAAVMCERQHAESTSRESEERFNLALSAGHVGTWEWHIRANRGWLSDKSREIFGLPADHPGVSFQTFVGMVHPDDRDRLSQAINAAVEEGSLYECEFRVTHPDSTVRWVLGKGKALYNAGKPDRMIGVNVDITEQKLAEGLRREEAALRQSEARFREMANAMPQIVWTVRPDGRLDYFNRRWYELTGAPEGETGTDNWLPMTHPDDRQVCIDALSQALVTGQPFQVEHRIKVQATGQYRWHLARAQPVRNEAGQIVLWYGTCTDIEQQKVIEQQLRDARVGLEQRVVERTAELSDAVLALREEIAERVAAERALRSSEERFGKAFHSSPDAIVIVRQSDYRLLEVNEKWEAMFGYARAEVLGRTAEELGIIIHEAESQDARNNLETKGYLRDFEIHARSKSGELLRIVLVTDTVEMAGEPCFIIIIRDVTERKRAESMLQEQQRELAHLSRVAALGELSGALAHELNQPLAAILANARAAQRIISADQPNIPEIRDILEDIALDDRRAGEVISRLRGLLKKGEIQARPVDLDEIVGEVLDLLHSDLIQRRVSVSTQLTPSLPPILGDRVQLQQVLLNLILNGCDAMAEKAPRDRRMSIEGTLTARGAVQLSVNDHGSGVAEERLDQIFEPFVTTKEDGLGLGLAICRSIVTAHGGRLWAVNPPEGGATFLMEFDPIDAQSTPAPDLDHNVAGEFKSVGTR
jgi:PAS domain S-box-containing protein